MLFRCLIGIILAVAVVFSQHSQVTINFGRLVSWRLELEGVMVRIRVIGDLVIQKDI